MWSIKKMREKYNQKAANGKGEQTEAEIAASFRDHVWVPDGEKVWTVATTVEQREATLLVKVQGEDGEPVEVPRKNTHQYDPSHALDLDDASKMNGMHEAPLLDLLLRRFKQDKIYTN